ncbi:MAG: acyltransferase family protein [Propionibacterium sp.]|nr:acyltransferase family protein [Propionibacterium sp.]
MPDVAGLLVEALQSAGALLDNLRQVSADDLRGWLDDPIDGLVRLGERFGVDWQDGAEATIEFARNRWLGDYAVDEFGFDPEYAERVYLPMMRPIVRQWFRVQASGLHRLPEGPALLVSNHAGALPLDSLVLQTVLHDEADRYIRPLAADLVFRTPFVADFARRTGSTYACQEDALRLLSQGHLVAAFPEGFKGLGKLYAERYRLQRFGRGGFVSTAVKAGVPIVPVSVVGSEEIYPMLSQVPAIARMFDLPYFPVTPTFPWLGALGFIPLPSKWSIRIGDPIPTDQLSGQEEDPATVLRLTDQVRHTIQRTLHELLEERRSVFW